MPTTWMVTLYAHPPVVVDRGSGGSFIDIDGNTYVDFNLADTSMFTGYGVQAIARAVGEQWSRVRSSCCPQRLRTRSRWN